MARINIVTAESANPEQQALFGAIQAQLGTVPNFLKVFANSPAALRAFLGCEYCLSAHTAIGRKAGLDGAEIEANRAGTSRDEKAAVAVRFARSLVAHMGEVTTAELLEMRSAGYSESDIVEVITHVGMNILTNLLGKAGRVDIDFPKIELKLAV
jgi:alkylhydroperoxidase family enzyme